MTQRKLSIEEAKKMMSENNGHLDLRDKNITELPEGLTVGGFLDLRGTPIKELPVGLTVGGSLDLSNTPIEKLPQGLVVGESLDLYNTPIEKLPDDLSVGGSLDLSNTPIEKLPDGLTVGGFLDLYNTPIEKLPDGLTVGGFLDLRGTLIKELPDGLTVGDCLDLHNTPIEKLPDGLTVGGSLDLSNTPIEELPQGLVVGGWLNLSNTPIEKLPDGLTVRGSLDLSNTLIKDKKTEKDKVHVLQNGDYVPCRYLYADGILTHIKKEKKLGDYTFYVGKIPGRNVISDGTHYAHCDKPRDGIADLLFKTAEDRGADQYKGLKLTDEVSLEDAVTMYRIITGACRQGAEHFVRNLPDVKKKYTIQECIDLTRGQYNAENFEEFFAIVS